MVKKKYNWWRDKVLTRKNDDRQLNALVSYLRFTHNIKKEKIKKDWYLLLDRNDFSLIGIYENVTESQLKANPVVRRPDIMIIDDAGNLKLIIELDGSIHRAFEPARKKTEQRNSDYHSAGITCIIIDTQRLKKLGANWFEFLDKELQKHYHP